MFRINRSSIRTIGIAAVIGVLPVLSGVLRVGYGCSVTAFAQENPVISSGENTAAASQDNIVKVSVDPINRSEECCAVVYNNTNGLPTSEANAIAETKEGFIWIGSYSGLIRYDGNSFERLSVTSGLGSITALFVDKDDRLWIGTNDSGLAVFDKGELTRWTKKEGMMSSSVRNIVQDEKGVIYASTTTGIAIVDNDMKLSFVQDKRIFSKYIDELMYEKDGLIYGLTNESDIFTLKDGEIVDYIDNKDIDADSVGCIIADPVNPGYAYIETGNSEMRYGSVKDAFKDHKKIDISPLTYVSRFEYIDGKLWICARNGVGVYDGKNFALLENVPMNNSIGNVMVDYEGNLWFTSTRQGVMKIVPNKFLDIYERYGLDDDVVNATLYTDDKLYVVSDSGLKVIGNEGPLSELAIKSAHTASGVDLGFTDLLQMLDGCRIRAIMKDSQDRIWISTWRKFGLLCYCNDEITAYTTADGMISDSIRNVWECMDGSLLVAVTGGANVIKDGKVTGYGEKDGIVNTDTLNVAQAFNGDLLIGSNGDGLYVISGDGAKTGTKTVGIEDGLTSEIIMRIIPDEKRKIYWLVTGNSLAYMDEDYKVTTLTDFPYSNNFDLYINSRDEIWVFSGNGIYVAPAQRMVANKNISPVHYGLSNGMPCIATANSYSSLAENGDLYIAGSTGVGRVNIENSMENVSDLKAAVPFIDADGKRIYPDEDGNFTVGKNVKKITVYSYVFNYSLTDPMISYKLEGFEDEAVEMNRSSLVPIDYTNLSGGTYNFVLEIKDSMGIESKTVSVKIIKVKAFYEEFWFYAVAVIGFLAVVIITVKLYIGRRIKKLEKKHKEETEKERISNELDMANKIQKSMLPNEFPPYPDRKEFDIYASMDPAKEVGGDFYDFYMIDDDHLCLVIADVSGKGIPAALFMMMSKIILQSCAILGKSAGEILALTNEAICSNNQMDMFVTVWLGILEISTGKITAANAGHEYPAIMRDGIFTLLKDKHGLAVGGMEGMEYREYEIQLKPGDKIFVYTDGVPEATDAANELFKTDRMLAALNIDPKAEPKRILRTVRQEVNKFVKDAEQFDDLTMLCMEYKG